MMTILSHNFMKIIHQQIITSPKESPSKSEGQGEALMMTILSHNFIKKHVNKVEPTQRVSLKDQGG